MAALIDKGLAMAEANNTNSNGETFEIWMIKVDAWLVKACGLGSADLVDCCYWDAWNDDVTPADMGREVLEENGYPLDLLETN